MSEPIRLWDKYGVEVITHSPSWAHAQVIAGLLFEQPPAQPVPVPDEAKAITEAAQKYAAAFGVSVEHARMLIEDVAHAQPTPNDTQEVDAVPAPKRRKRGGGGVL